MTGILPSVASIKGWKVDVTAFGTLEVVIILGDKQEARSWATWLADKEPGKQ